MSEVQTKGKLAKVASFQMNRQTTEQKNEALRQIAVQLLQDAAQIIEANKIDLQQGQEKGLTTSVLDRILLDESRIKAICDAVLQVVELQDPVNELLETIDKENGLHIEKRRVPLGVIGMIYEARPNVTVDAATLALKTGNAVILRGSSSAKYSNIAIVASIHRALARTSVPVEAVQLIEDTRRETASELFHLKQYLDVLIPRGGKALIDTVVSQATVPVLETGAGNCHIYIDETAQYDMVIEIVLNAKTQRPSVCNAIESLCIHEKWFAQYGETFITALQKSAIEVRGDDVVQQASNTVIAATEEDYATEFLDLIVSVKTVANVEEAVAHINQYGTKHSEAIITMTNETAQYFQNNVDAAAVYYNASTRFTDGFEFGYGAEIGISTQKLHARGPMGLPALTSTKVYISGTGQVRS